MADATRQTPIKVRPTSGCDGRLETTCTSTEDIRVNGTAKSASQLELETLLASGFSHQTIHLTPEASYTSTQALDLRGVSPGTLIDGHGAKIIESGDIDSPLMSLKQHGIKLINLRLIGSETDGDTWAGSDVDDDEGLRLAPPDGGSFLEAPVVERCEFNNFTYGVRAVNCRRGRFDLTSRGHLTGNPSIDALTALLGAGTRRLNYNAGLSIRGGEDNQVWIRGSDHGQLLLLGNTTKRCTIHRAVGERLYDNGVYVSSGEDTDVRYVHITDCYSSALKMRGSGEIRRVIGNGCLNVCTVSPLTGIDGARAVIGHIEGTFRNLGLNVDELGGAYMDSVVVSVAHLRRLRTDGKGNPLPRSYLDYFPGLYAARVLGGPNVDARRMSSFTLGELMVDLGDFTADVSPDNQKSMSGVLLNYVLQATMMRSLVRASTPTNLCRGIVAVGCDRPRIYGVRGENVRRVVQLTDTLGARVTLNLGGANCSTAVYETGTTDETVIDGELGSADTSLVGPDSRLLGMATAAKSVNTATRP